MKPSDWYLDLQDLLGKLLPGLLIIVELIFGYKKFNLIKTFEFISTFDSFFEIFIALVISYVVGSYSTYVTYRFFRDWLIKKYRRNPIRSKIKKQYPDEIIGEFVTLELFLKLNDKTGHIWEDCKNRPEFKKASKLNYWDLQPYCKNSLAELSPQVFLQLKKFEAQIDFYTGMTIPLALSIIVIALDKSAFFENLYYFRIFIIFLISSALFVNVWAMKNETESENYLTFIWYHSVLSKRDLN